jgi:hypothetical protein
MTTIPLKDCCTMLGIDPKTVRQWLGRAQMQLAPHPTDARDRRACHWRKCISWQQCMSALCKPLPQRQHNDRKPPLGWPNPSCQLPPRPTLLGLNNTLSARRPPACWKKPN